MPVLSPRSRRNGGPVSRWMTTTKAGRKLGIQASTIRALIRRGKIEFRKEPRPGRKGFRFLVDPDTWDRQTSTKAVCESCKHCGRVLNHKARRERVWFERWQKEYAAAIKAGYTPDFRTRPRHLRCRHCLTILTEKKSHRRVT